MAYLQCHKSHPICKIFFVGHKNRLQFYSAKHNLVLGEMWVGHVLDRFCVRFTREQRVSCSVLWEKRSCWGNSVTDGERETEIEREWQMVFTALFLILDLHHQLVPPPPLSLSPNPSLPLPHSCLWHLLIFFFFLSIFNLFHSLPFIGI